MTTSHTAQGFSRIPFEFDYELNKRTPLQLMQAGALIRIADALESIAMPIHKREERRRAAAMRHGQEWRERTLHELKLRSPLPRGFTANSMVRFLEVACDEYAKADDAENWKRVMTSNRVRGVGMVRRQALAGWISKHWPSKV